jgi:hypothetical protein
MLSSCLGIGAISLQLNHLLSLSCYKLLCHYFLHLLSTLCPHTYPISCILLLCSAAQKMRSALMKTSARRAKPLVISCGMMVCFPLLSPFWTCNKFFCNKIRCNKHGLCYLFHYLSLYV